MPNVTPDKHAMISDAVDKTMTRLRRIGAIDNKDSGEAWVSMIELAQKMFEAGQQSIDCGNPDEDGHDCGEDTCVCVR